MKLLATKLQTERVGPAQACRNSCGFASYFWVAELMGLLWIFCSIGIAQNAPPTLLVDPFILAIERMKQAVASLDCLAVNGGESKILERMGTAFLVSSAGDFLTAAHVVMEMQNGERTCPTTAITFPAHEWHPEARTEEMRWFPFKTSDCTIENRIDVAKCQ